jgi:hypothetical protein
MRNSFERESEGTLVTGGLPIAQDTGLSARPSVAIVPQKSEETTVATHSSAIATPVSGCAPLVTVMEAAHLGDSHDSSLFR